MSEATKREKLLKDEISYLIYQNLSLWLQARNTDISAQVKDRVKSLVHQLFDVNAILFMDNDENKLYMLAQQIAGTANIGADGKVELTGLSKDISTHMRLDNSNPPSLFEKALDALMIFLGVSKSQKITYFMFNEMALKELEDSNKSDVSQSIHSFKPTKEEMEAFDHHFLSSILETLLWQNVERNLRRKGDGFMYPAIEFNIRAFIRQLLSQLPRDFFIMEKSEDFPALADKIAGMYDLYGTGQLTGLSALIYQAGNTPDKTSAERYFDEFKHLFGFKVDYHSRFAITSEKLAEIQAAGLAEIKDAKAELLASKNKPDLQEKALSAPIIPLATVHKGRKKVEHTTPPTQAPKSYKRAFELDDKQPKKKSKKIK